MRARLPRRGPPGICEARAIRHTRSPARARRAARAPRRATGRRAQDPGLASYCDPDATQFDPGDVPRGARTPRAARRSASAGCSVGGDQRTACSRAARGAGARRSCSCTASWAPRRTSSTCCHGSGDAGSARSRSTCRGSAVRRGMGLPGHLPWLHALVREGAEQARRPAGAARAARHRRADRARLGGDESAAHRAHRADRQRRAARLRAASAPCDLGHAGTRRGVPARADPRRLPRRRWPRGTGERPLPRPVSATGSTTTWTARRGAPSCASSAARRRRRSTRRHGAPGRPPAAGVRLAPPVAGRSGGRRTSACACDGRAPARGVPGRAAASCCARSGHWPFAGDPAAVREPVLPFLRRPNDRSRPRGEPPRRGAPPQPAQPPIALIVRGGLDEPGSLTWCLSSLRQTASRTIGSSSASSAPARSGLAQVGLVQGEQAGPQLAVGGQADAVAVARRTARRPGR